MMAFLRLVFIAVIVAGAYVLFEEDVRAWMAQRNSNSSEPAASSPTGSPPPIRSLAKEPEDATPAPPPAFQPMHIVCPVCEGETRLSYVDRRGRNHNYPCRICGMIGARNFDLPHGSRVCPDCKGMGRTIIFTHRTDAVGGTIIGATRCTRCNLLGYITLPVSPGSGQPTRGVRTPVRVR